LGFRPYYVEKLNTFFKFTYLWGWLQLYDFNNNYSNQYFNIDSKYIDSLNNLKKYFFIDSTEIKTSFYTIYSNLLRTYNRFLCEKDYKKIPSFDVQFTSAINSFEGYYRDLLLTRLIKDGLKKNEVKPEHISKFMEICKTGRYVDFVNKILLSKINQSTPITDTSRIIFQKNKIFSTLSFCASCRSGCSRSWRLRLRSTRPESPKRPTASAPRTAPRGSSTSYWRGSTQIKGEQKKKIELERGGFRRKSLN
jgi:hypothetical protein